MTALVQAGVWILATAWILLKFDRDVEREGKKKDVHAFSDDNKDSPTNKSKD